MKLLIVSHSCATAANQRLYAELASLTGWDLTLAIPRNWRDEFGNVLDEKPPADFSGRVLKIPVLANGSIILHFYRKNWTDFLRREAFDGIYVNHEPYAVATAQVSRANLRQPRPAVFGFYSCQNIRKTYPFPFSGMEASVFRNSRFAFPITAAVESVLHEKGFRGETAVCPLPFDPGQYFPREPEENFKIVPREPGQVVLGFVGRLVETKGLRTLSEALPQLKDLPWKLVVVGRGEYEAEFRRRLEAQGLSARAIFTGYVPHEETPRYLSAFDLLVLPSETQPNWKEQFGRVIVEALACGAAVAGSDSGEIPNLISASGGGLIFAERDPNALAGALRKMIETPSLRKSCASSGRAWASQWMSIPTVAKVMATTIENALKSR